MSIRLISATVYARDREATLRFYGTSSGCSRSAKRRPGATRSCGAGAACS